MSRIALIYPKLAIFRSRKQLNASQISSVVNSEVPKNSPNILSNHGVNNNKQLVPQRKLSNQSAAPSLQTATNVIQQDQIDITSKALLELVESKNSSNLILEKRAKRFCDLYRSLEELDKKLTLNQLALLWSGQQEATLNSVKKYLTAQEKGEDALIKAEAQLRSTLAVDQTWMLSSLARQEGGIKFLIDIRTDILNQIELEATNVVAFRSLSNAIRDLIAPCFGIDLLHLERVTWSSPGNVLQHISEGEAVHPVRSWSDLKKRLGPYRRCFVLSHPAVPIRPLAILHVALTTEISTNINSIIARSTSLSIDLDSDSPRATDDEDTELINTVIFYSISATQKGLAGIDLGQCLIKRAVRALQMEIPSLQQFSSLSPIPGFRSWLMQQLREYERGRETVFTKFNWGAAEELIKGTEENPFGQLRQLLVDSSWMKEDAQAELLEGPLMRLCAHYLFVEKRRGFALDSVANFHLRNGAVMWRLNWAADLSPRGLKNSFGMMVNYRYYLEACEDNSQFYVEKQHIECSEQIRHLSGNENTSTINVSRL